MLKRKKYTLGFTRQPKYGNLYSNSFLNNSIQLIIVDLPKIDTHDARVTISREGS